MAKSQAAGQLKTSTQLLISGILALLIYIPTFFWLWERWFSRDSYYSHGPLIPFVTAYLIWLKKDVLKTLIPETNKWGMGLFFTGIGIHIFSALFRVYFSSGLSMILVIFGLVLHFYGTKILKQILFPLLFLVFMVPLPMVVVANISFKLKIMAATISVHFLNAMHIYCIQDGSAIIMRHAYVVVDDVCSGLRSLITLLALGSLFAYWMKSSRRNKIILMVLTVPIAVMANVARIMFLAFVNEVWGSKAASGALHDASGFVAFASAFALLYTACKTLE